MLINPHQTKSIITKTSGDAPMGRLYTFRTKNCDTGGCSPVAEFIVKRDQTAPTGGSVGNTNGYQTTTAITVSVNRGVDNESGMSSNNSDYTLKVASASLSNGACGAYSAYADANVSETATAFSYSYTGKEGYEVDEADLRNFFTLLRDRGVLIETNQPQGALIYYEDRECFRQDCLVAPTSVTLYITEYCPKTCTHCVVRSSPKIDRTAELGVSQWIEVLRKLRDFGVCALVFTGGEPLVKDGIFEILQRADELKFAISVLTDFDGLNKGHIARLNALRHLHDIQVSLDGGTDTTHDSIRGKGAFQMALRRMAVLQDQKVQYTISSTISRRNIDELNQIVEIYREYGAAYLYINPLAPYGRAKELMQGEILSDDQLRWLGQRYLELIVDGVIETRNFFWNEHAAQRGDPNFHPFKEALTAVSIGTYNFSIGSRGECYLDSKVKSEGLMYLGDIFRDDIEAMWYSPKLDHLRAHFSPNHFTFTDQANILVSE